MPPKQKPQFTTDWFTSHQAQLWQKMIVPKLSDKDHVSALEIGTYEGRSALYMLEHVLTAPTSHLTCVDDFRDMDPLTAKAGVASVKAALLKNLGKHASKFTLIEAPAEKAMRAMASEQFDLIYIDADKNSRYVLEHAVLAFPLLKKNGYIVFDDYTSSAEHDGSCPKRGIDAFIEVYAPFLRVKHMGWQVILQKRATPLGSARKAKCHSEYFDAR